MPQNRTQFALGQRIAGTKYVLCGELGKGGMGTVYEVVKEPGIRGAMKVMSPALAKREDCVARFFAEVRLLAQLRHRNIVDVYDFDRLEDGTPFLVMEKLDGETLRTTLRKSTMSGRGFPARGAYEVTRQVCEGLYRAHTHATAVVHRDIKPENLFLNQLPGADEVAVKVLDFGVASLVDGKRDRRQFGTPKYMAPEQLRGEPVSPRTDLYAVALVLYEMLTGRLPWDCEREIDAYCVAPIPPSRFAPWVPPSVDALIARALAIDPSERPHSAFAFASQLYELQWVDDGRSRPIDCNTTSPTLTALVSSHDSRAACAHESGHDTYRGPTTPPLEGRSLEIAEDGSTPFSEASTEAASPRSAARIITPDPPNTTRVPLGEPTVDRSAPTREQAATTDRVPRVDTEPIVPPRAPIQLATPPPEYQSTRETAPVAAGTSLSIPVPARDFSALRSPRRPFTRYARASIAALCAALFAFAATRSTPRPAAGVPGEPVTLSVQPSRASATPVATPLTPAPPIPSESASQVAPIALTPRRALPRRPSGPKPLASAAPAVNAHGTLGEFLEKY